MMLRIFGGSANHCEGLTRSGFRQAGALGLGGLPFRALVAARAEGKGASPAAYAGDSVILFWVSAGPGHMEAWDAKPEAPALFRGPLGAIPSRVPGVLFGELLPEQ